jgi:uncharacterized protein YjbJ (UPF0337 family)
MKQSTKHKIKGEMDQIKGKVKERTGRVTNDPELEDEGTAEKVGGKVKKKVGDIEKVFEQ